jgi:hypothetical protein
MPSHFFAFVAMSLSPLRLKRFSVDFVDVFTQTLIPDFEFDSMFSQAGLRNLHQRSQHTGV